MSNDSHKKVLIIYTGGTIGMKQTEDGYAPAPGWMEQQLRSIYAFQDPKAPPRTTPPAKSGSRIVYDIIEYDPLMDSANMEIHHWVRIAKDIEKHYDDYDGFVVLHGTDTMSYTASALSFMLVNLRKTVVLTGSQIPLSEVRNDAVNNLLGALTMAGLYEIPEVCLYFDNQLLRGNRSQKFDASGLGAFKSGNLPPLAKVGIEIEVAWHLINSVPARPLRLRTIKEQNVVALRLFPGISTQILDNFLQPPVRGVVLETYGAGNVPATRQDFLEVLHKATQRGIIIVNCTQCFQGMVTSDYAAGSVLNKIGVVSGHDMTPEAALTKLAYLLSQEDVSSEEVKKHMLQNLRGELTLRHKEKRFSFQEQNFVESIAKVLSQGEDFGISQEISASVFPVLMCSAASRGDIEAIERMLASKVSVDISDYDGRTALHLAAAEGKLEMVQFLLTQGANVHAQDRWAKTALHDAIRHRHDSVASALQEAGASLHDAELIGELCQAASEGRVEDLRRLIDNGANPNAADYDRRTPLHLAAASGHLETIQYLLQKGANATAQDRWGNRPLDDAKNHNQQVAIEILKGL